MKRQKGKLSRTNKSNEKEMKISEKSEYMEKGKNTSTVKTTEVVDIEKGGPGAKIPANTIPVSYADIVKKGRWIEEDFQPSTSGYVNAPMKESRTKNQGGTLEDAVRGERKNEGETDIYYSDTVTSDPSKTGGKPSYAGAVKGKYSMNVCVY